jgi:hypothetical protein
MAAACQAAVLAQLTCHLPCVGGRWGGGWRAGAAVPVQPAWVTCHLPLCGGGGEVSGGLAQWFRHRPSRYAVNHRRGGGVVGGGGCG